MSTILVENTSDPSFRQLELSAPLFQAIEEAGYSVPTPIQTQTIPLLLAGRDVMGQAQTGTGKTAAFALPMLQRIDLSNNNPQVLVLVPTRELAIQVSNAIQKYASKMSGLRVVSVYGGQSYDPQLQQLKRGGHIIVGTPGRVMDHMRRGTLKLDSLGGLVLDEADEMLRMGFAEDVEWVLSKTPPGRQIALFSATFPAPIRRIATQHLQDPAEVTIEKRTITAETVNQHFLVVGSGQKEAVLGRVLESEKVDAMLVFVKTRATTEPLAEYLRQCGHRVAALHGDIAQRQRERIIEQLRAGNLDVIVATDVAARGLDVQRISHVINFDLPYDSEAYVHRIGRTGRAGRSGEAILFVHPRERRVLQRIERATGKRIDPMEMPSNRTINKMRVSRFHDRITAALSHADLESFESIIEQYQRDNDVPAEKVAAALAILANGKKPLFLQGELKLPALDAGPRDTRHAKQDRPQSHPGGRNDRGRRRCSDEDMETFRIEVGYAHQVRPGNIVGAISNESGLDSEHIGRIEIFDKYSTVDLPTGMPSEFFHSLKHVWVSGRKLNISKCNEPHSPGRRKFGKKSKSKFKSKQRKSHAKA